LLLAEPAGNIFLVAVMGIWLMFRSPVAALPCCWGILMLTLGFGVCPLLAALGDWPVLFSNSDYAVWMAVVSLVKRFSSNLFLWAVWNAHI
jgi:hypothetical protein